MAAFIMAGPLQATGFVVLFALLGLFLPLLGLLSSSAVGLVTLRLGLHSGLRVIAFSALALTLVGLVMAGNLSLALVVTLLQWVPVLLLAALLQRSASWQKVLLTVLGVAIGGVLLFHVAVGDTETFWKQRLQLQQIDSELFKQLLPGTDIGELVDKIAETATGFLGALLSLGLIISLMIARHWQANLYNPGGFGEELADLQLPKPAGIAMGVLVTLGLLIDSSLLVDVVIVGLAIFLFQGISLVHGLHRMKNLHIGWLIGFYVSLFIIPQLVILLGAFGIIDSIADFRGHMKSRH